MAFTVRYANSLTGGQAFRGTFEHEHEARTYRDREASRARSFVTFEIWRGSSANPIGPVPGSLVKGGS